jgi:elongation factor G
MTRRWAPSIRSKRFPPNLLKKAEAFRMQLVEMVAETDDEILEQFLEGEDANLASSRPACARRPSI